jgi:glycosyltransferase involved in cell wall biosynthesis
MISETFLPITGGLQFQVKYLAEEIANQGAEIYLLSYSDGNSFLKKNLKNFPSFVRLEKRNSFSGIFELYREINKISPDVIHVHSAEKAALQISILKWLFLIRKPLIVTSHGVDIMKHKKIGYGLRLNPIFAILVRIILKTCNKHVLVGKSMLKYALDAGSNLNKITVINNGVNFKYDSFVADRLVFISEKYKLEPEDKVMLSLSGMRPLKAIEVLIKSLPIILKDFPQTKLLLACSSKDDYEQSIRKLVNNLSISNNVIFIGFITDEEEKINLLRRCDVLCKPSRLEACSVAILEAMKEGRVVVASVPGGIDIITNEEDGILVEVDNHKAYADAIIRIFKDEGLRNKIQINAKKSFKTTFDISITARKYLELYSELSKN